MKSLKVEDYQLAKMNRTELITAFKEENITMKEVLDVVPQYKALDKRLVENVENAKTEKTNLIDFLTQLRKAFVDGKIKYEESKYSTGGVSLKTTSFKANIKRVGKETGLSTAFLEYQSYGNYYISSGFGRDYELALHKIVTEDTFEDLLNIVEDRSVLQILNVYRELQKQHRELHDTDYKMYNEIREFQNSTNVVVSDKIFNNKGVPADELKDVYEVFKTVKETVKYAHKLADDINGKYNI